MNEINFENHLAGVIEFNYLFRNEKHSLPNHSSPEDYGLTRNDVDKMRLRYLNKKHKEACEEVNHYNSMVMRYNDIKMWVLFSLEAIEKRDKIYREIMMIKNNRKNHNPFSISQLKQIPIDTIVSVNAAGFFKVRDEKTPSCKWYKNDNTWVDFGGDNKKHDVIDLVMIIRDCSFVEACKYLS